MLRKLDLWSKTSLLVYCCFSLPNFSTHKNIFCWLLQPVQIPLRRVEFLIKFISPYLQVCAEFSKLLRKAALNKRMLNCKIFIPTLSKLTRRCRRVLLWSHATQTYLSTQALILSSGRFFFTVIARTSLLIQADIFFPLSWPVQTKPSTRTFSYHRHNPHKITCPYNGLHRPTCPHGRCIFLFLLS